MLLFVVDPWDPTGEDESEEQRAQRVRDAVKALRAELEAYHPRLLQKPWLVAVNKVDLGRVVDPKLLPRSFYVSAQAHTGLKPLVDGLWIEIGKARAAAEE